jgi:hypothetical protein
MLRRGAHRVLGITAEMIDWWFSCAKRAGSALQDLISRPPLRKPRHPAIAGRRAQVRTLSRNERQGHWFSAPHPHEDVGFGPAAITLHVIPRKTTAFQIQPLLLARPPRSAPNRSILSRHSSRRRSASSNAHLGPVANLGALAKVAI